MNKKKGYANGGEAAAIVAKILGESGKTISDADRARIANIIGESGKTISDADRVRVKAAMKRKGGGSAMKKKKGYAKGGAAKKMANGGMTNPFGLPGIGEFERSQAPGIAAAAPAALEPFRGNLLDKQVSSNLLDNAMMTRASSPTSGASRHNSPSASANQNQNLTNTIYNTNTLGAGATGRQNQDTEQRNLSGVAEELGRATPGPLPSMLEPFDVGPRTGIPGQGPSPIFKPAAVRGMKKGGSAKVKVGKGGGAALRGNKKSRIF